MNQHIKYLFLVCILILGYLGANAQSPGSANTENTTRYVGGTRTSLAETLYLGPNANITVDGTWHVYSKYVWISPLAQITGSGSIIFHNPGEVGGAGGPTVIDGNNNLFIDANVVHANHQGMEIENVTLPTDLSSLGWANNISISTLKIGKDFNMSVNGADVWLDASAGVVGDFTFDNDATISGYRPERMVITNNSIQSHMVKQGAASGFIFPVGITDGDYTPAQVTGSGTYHVSVQDYPASTSNETLLSGGPERTWHIYSDVAGAATVALQHNAPTDVSPFDSGAPHYVTQYSGAAWSTGTEEAGLPGVFTTGSSPVSMASTQDLSGVAIPALGSDPTSYLTKANNKTSLPVTLILFTAKNEAGSANLSWTTSEETNADRFEIERSLDGKNWIYLGEKAATGESKTIRQYAYADSDPASGINYYRLKMIDRDETYTYSRVRSVEFKGAAIKLAVYPNPVTDVFFLKHGTGNILLTERVKEVSIFDKNGTTVYFSKTIPKIATEGIVVRELSPGMYIVKVSLLDGTFSTHKLIVNK